MLTEFIGFPCFTFFFKGATKMVREKNKETQIQRVGCLHSRRHCLLVKPSLNECTHGGKGNPKICPLST